jgi:drug/metabolite transporter (DMT)-like permease
MNKSIEDGFFKRNLNIIMFCTLSLSWGFSWFCGRYQINTQINNIQVFPEISGCYRLFLAAIFLAVLYIPIKKPRLIPTTGELKVIAGYAPFSFCMNFIIYYYAIYKMVTGINAIIFSFSIIFNHIIGRFVFKTKKDFDYRFYLSAFIGILGLFLVLLSKISNLKLGYDLVVGILICLAGTLSYSFGSTFYESKAKTIPNNDPIMMFIWCLIAGGFFAIFIGFVHSFIAGVDFRLVANFNVNFVVSLLYLAGPATAVGYLCGMLLIQRIGSVKASYTSLISPVIAIVVTSIFEDYKFTIATLVGIVLISSSKVIMFYKPKATFVK